ncbi:hypothetical protein D2V93_00215 [Flagellimonas taeanensis]|uniref:LysE family transporter n=1 Tax=Flavobacteriaceae TaxID=49546 RepID=UPI000E678F58|nr:MULTISPECIES: LysE family transporter [Allomuricauda]MDC6384295.1 LysE family transporter [Muricauda sp. SK9]RIV49650.1 hypothetical protein D2V93_12710 [Allomuricauda taeanensis]RIV53849.1 hypothetical protein D2V93_00215 [Allomuricauda taeanensis]
MPNYAKVCFYGLLISFVGALPFGTLNLTAFDIAASQGLVSAIWFAMAVVLVELSVVRITLYGNERLHLGERALKYILPLGIVFLLYLSLSSFLEMDSVTVTDSKTDFFPQIGSTFVLGLLLSALNPLQFPFWMTWNQVLDRKGILQRSNSHYVFYILGIGLGTLVGLGIFILAGKFIFANYDRYHTITNLMMGLLYLGFSFYLMFIFIKKRIHHKIE